MAKTFAMIDRKVRCRKCSTYFEPKMPHYKFCGACWTGWSNNNSENDFFFSAFDGTELGVDTMWIL